MKNILAMTMLAILLSGCASITGSKMQAISVNTVNHDGDVVDDAKCSLMNDKGSWYVTTPGSVTIQKSYGDMTVTCKKKRLPSGVVDITSKSNGGVWGNILAGGIIGYAVDASSGAGFDYPTNINVEMGRSVVLVPEVKKSSQSTNNR